MGSGPGDHGGGDQSVAASHGHSGCGPHHEAKRQAWDCPPWSLRREHSPVDTLTSDLKPPELGEFTFLLFQVTGIVVICYSSPRKRLQI